MSPSPLGQFRISRRKQESQAVLVQPAHRLLAPWWADDLGRWGAVPDSQAVSDAELVHFAVRTRGATTGENVATSGRPVKTPLRHPFALHAVRAGCRGSLFKKVSALVPGVLRWRKLRAARRLAQGAAGKRRQEREHSHRQTKTNMHTTVVRAGRSSCHDETEKGTT
jgi:hypothetical protein